MPAASGPQLERVNGFPIRDTLLFKNYFEGDDVFERLKAYYNGTKYRFEVPVDELDSLRRFLREHDYDVCVVERPAEFYVVVRQFTEHPDGIFKDSVYHERVDGYNAFLMKDREAVAATVDRAATRLSSTQLSVRPATLGDFAATTS